MNEDHLCNWLSKILPNVPEATDAFRASLCESPERIANAYRELLSGYQTKVEDLISITLELSDTEYPGLIVARDIPFLSFCCHHFLPFHGTLDIIYQPGKYILGLGKLPRIVHCRAARFQIQESLVKEVALDLMTHAKARGVYVRSKAVHTCICYRGPTSYPTTTTTSFSAGTITSPDFVSVLNSL